MAKRSLLLVDGDAKSLRVLEVSLKKAGFNVTTAMSGHDALETVRNSQPDLVISDTDLPEMDGYAFCREFKGNPEWAEIPFIFLTGQTGIEHKIKGLELGVDDYLTKPIYIKEILTRVRILLQKRDRTKFEQKKDNNTRFAGRLNDMGVVDLIQTIEVSRKTGVIHFRADERRQATLFFKDGRVIDAEAGHLQGEDAVYRLLTWSDGEFEALFRPVRRKPVIEMSAQGLLMEGMRRLDEWGRLQEQLPPLTQKFEVVYDELWDRLADLPDDLNQILRLFDSRRTLAEVIDGANIGDLEAVEIISKLYFEGIIVEAGTAQGGPSGSFPIEGLLRQKNKAPLPADLEDTVPQQERPATDFSESPGLQEAGLEEQPATVNDACADEADFGESFDVPAAASAEFAENALGAPIDEPEADEADFSDALDEPAAPVVATPNPEHLADLLDQAITDAEPLAASAREKDPNRTTTPGFAVAQLKITQKETTKEELLADNLRKNGSSPKKILKLVPPIEPSDPESPAEESQESADTDPQIAAGAEPAPEADNTTEEEAPAAQSAVADDEGADIEVDALDAGEDDEAPQRPYVEEVELPGVISSEGAVNKSVSGSLAITTLPIPSKMPKPGYEDEEPDALDSTARKTKTARISSYDEGDDDGGGAGGFPIWLAIGAIAAGVMGVVIITGGNNKKAAGTSAHSLVIDASVETPQPTGTPVLPVAIVDAAVAVAPTINETPDARPAELKPDPVKPPTPVNAVVDTETKIRELLSSARRAERNKDRLEALQLIDEALELRKSSSALQLKAELLTSLGDSAAALGVAKELTRVAPRRAEGWRLQGQAQYEQKNYKGARASFARYLELAPSGAHATDVRALLESM